MFFQVLEILRGVKFKELKAIGEAMVWFDDLLIKFISKPWFNKLVEHGNMVLFNHG